jgi:hypothetical protein
VLAARAVARRHRAPHAGHAVSKLNMLLQASSAWHGPVHRAPQRPKRAKHPEAAQPQAALLRCSRRAAAAPPAAWFLDRRAASWRPPQHFDCIRTARYNCLHLTAPSAPRLTSFDFPAPAPRLTTRPPGPNAGASSHPLPSCTSLSLCPIRTSTCAPRSTLSAAPPRSCCPGTDGPPGGGPPPSTPHTLVSYAPSHHPSPVLNLSPTGQILKQKHPPLSCGCAVASQ